MKVPVLPVSQRRPGSKTSTSEFEWRQQLVALLLYVATTLLVVNQRVGFTDSAGFNFLAIVLRSDVWYVAAVAVGLILMPKMTLWPSERVGVATTVLWRMPVAFLLTILIASLLSAVKFDKTFDPFGALDVARTILCICVGILVFNLSVVSSTFSLTLIKLITFSSLGNVMAAIFTSTTSINNIDGFNAETTGDVEVGLGFVSYGNRFQGLATNPNIVMTQGMIAMALLVPEILQIYSKDGWRKALLLLTYAVALVSIILWTGVRAALILFPMICLIAVWLRTKPGLKSQMTAFIVIIQMFIIFAGAWFVATAFGLTDTLLERVSGSEDGRLNLWTHYFGLLLENPFGLGVAFESIADTYSIVERQRLPPHNSVLQTGMYGGFIAILLLFFWLTKIIRLFARFRRFSLSAGLSTEIQGIFIAWCVVVVSSFFGGLLSADFNFVVLTGLLVAMVSRTLPRERRKAFYSRL